MIVVADADTIIQRHSGIVFLPLSVFSAAQPLFGVFTNNKSRAIKNFITSLKAI